MIKFQVITLFPNYFDSVLKESLLAKSIEKGLIDISFINPRDWAEGASGRIDDYPFGGGDGMVLQYQALEGALKSLKERGKVIYMSPQGQLWNHKKAKAYANENSTLTIVCGRYAGIDQRFINDFVDEEISVGDYVLNGGEAAFLILLESLFRFIPGALGNEKSCWEESFEGHGLLEGPQWTRPQLVGSEGVPEVLLSGHHEKIKKWKYQVSLVLTSIKRPDILSKHPELKGDLLEARQALLSLSEKELRDLGIEKESI